MFHGQSQRQHDMAKKALASKTGEVKYLQQGPIGPLVYPAGEYSASTGYTRTALSTPMVLCEGQYYVLAKEGTFKGRHFRIKTTTGLTFCFYSRFV